MAESPGGEQGGLPPGGTRLLGMLVEGDLLVVIYLWEFLGIGWTCCCSSPLGEGGRGDC